MQKTLFPKSISAASRNNGAFNQAALQAYTCLAMPEVVQQPSHPPTLQSFGIIKEVVVKDKFFAYV
jgi:hypothetical protein